ncbi:hypothetical protein SPI_01021 [Niveomyces insectorum RCEF 264]|uniref:Uncharacterized protein n=1 Tax=Niveomyces insectorum RCEF 264 TaxID=1081102 RepID=A0A167YLJ0_9HYPO|nr:hypothetical protein SPI_01021 [Niveomyces insectorum RCEF 264]
MSSAIASKVIPTVVTLGAVSGVVAYVRQQLNRESNTMDRYFASYNTPQSEASRRRVFEGASEDPRTSLLNVLSWK